jgi:spermidine/putrescine transport system ATP-binding protein
MASAVAEPALRLVGIEKHYPSAIAVAGIDLDVGQGEFVTLLGPSGCGKTTTLSLIAGFFPPTRGEIWLKGRHVEGLPSFKRDIGVVFQDYALFPHMTAAENVAFGLRMRKIASDDVRKRVAEALELVQLTGLGDRRPLQMSGGQRQRVALARALVINPAVLLLDEPLSNLDLKLREEMRVEIAALQRRLGITTVFVTHDQGEALVMSDRIAVMNAGRIEQIGSPADIYERPSTRFVAQFIGRMNLIAGKVTPSRTVAVAGGTELPIAVEGAVPSGSDVHIAVRPERAELRQEKPSGGVALACTLRQVLYLGSTREFHVDLDGDQRGIVEMPNDGNAPRLETGARAWFYAPVESCRVLRA